MRLTKIKLAGFKSFVDPTTFHMPSNLVGIVGPNGCGKSNLIDAARWVMGESSARTLRGESMADVIFNGSSSRKPVGQAFVELSFDNSSGKLGGSWGRYGEIAVKRLVSRDGQSSYFLNGVRCRRRDITDIFLGTGLGPRSYAIIEQGTISRIVEAKPEELRLFLEQAAGVAKYKERRRETETRIRHTRENLERLSDLREELAKQLGRLQRQAQNAERYKKLRARERHCKAMILALRWQALDADIRQRQALIREAETVLEAAVADQRRLEARLADGRQRHADMTDSLNGVQEQHYGIGAEITRLELSLAHQQDLRRRQQQELSQLEDNLSQLCAEIEQDRARLEQLEASLRSDEQELALAREVDTECGEHLAETEAELAEYQVRWEHFNERAGRCQRVAEVERTRIEHLERQQLQHERRSEQLRLEQDELDRGELEDEMADLCSREQEVALALAFRQRQFTELGSELAELQKNQGTLARRLQQAREGLQAGRGRMASLETLQEAALGKHEGAVGAWTKAQGLDQAPRLAEQLDVEAGWERATEVVLGTRLEAICVESLESMAPLLSAFEDGYLTLFESAVPVSEAMEGKRDRLSDKVRAPWPLSGLLAGVRTAVDLGDALRRRAQLADWQSLVTPEGIWLGRDWLRIARGPSDHQLGILAREREIQRLSQALQRDSALVEDSSRELDCSKVQLQGLEQRRDTLQDELNQGHRQHARLQGEINALENELEHRRIRRDAIAQALEELDRHRSHELEEIQQARLTLEEALLSTEQLVAERQALIANRQGLDDALKERRARATAARQTMQQRALAVESQRSSAISLRQALIRLESQRAQLETRGDQVRAGLPPAESESERHRLEALLESRLRLEKALTEARSALEAQDQGLRERERDRVACEKRVGESRQSLEHQRLALSEASIRRQTILDQSQELGMDLQEVLAATEPDTDEAALQRELDGLAGRIQRLGPINLAAIEECAELTERKSYLDAQNEDLVEALTTLESAIRKIDRDTRARFKETFRRVDEGFKTLFPRLFGGGQAHLALAGEDLLDAGVSIMARPPGKRISHIQLLSGGEKALTAVAFVFAIFRLNPAPFCMLDEVDAPLDEANVGRFGDLVKEMSEQIQFIFITHNKGTMEIAYHLSGVTMHEPGVSRLVSVDVAQAVALAAE